MRDALNKHVSFAPIPCILLVNSQGVARPAGLAEAAAAPAEVHMTDVAEASNSSAMSLEGVVDADAATASDPAQVPEYVNQIYSYFKEAEVSARAAN
jgi:hypothetical protein